VHLLCLLRTQAEFEESKREDQQAPSSQADRSPPIILTSETDLLQFQKKFRGTVKGNCEFRNIENGTSVVKIEMADLSAIKTNF
jgi:hypothetical protein